jgi:predicted RNA-binding protein with TRAM domain
VLPGEERTDMSHQDPGTPDTGWNPPTAPPMPAPDAAGVALGAHSEVSSAPRRSRIGTGIAVAAVAVGAVGLAGTAYAATSSTSPSPTPPGGGYGAPQGQQPPQGYGPNGAAPAGQAPPGMPGGMRGHGPGEGMGMRGFGLGMGIHGSFVTPKQGGGYQTVDTQRGTVTAVSSTQVTVKSEDGFTKSYLVTADTLVNAQRDGIASIKTGDTVLVTGIESGSEVKAVSVIDVTQVKNGWQRVAPPRPAPSASKSTA